MKLKTRHFGEIDIDEDKIITFEEGLPGFPQDKQFILLDNPAMNQENNMFYWLQSATDGDNAFILMDTISCLPDYNPLVDRDEIASLGDYNEEDFYIYNVVVLPEEVQNMSVNLVAPVVINAKNKRGKQVVVNNDDYSVRHFLFNEMRG